MPVVDELQAVNDVFNAAINCGDASAAAWLFTNTAVCIAPTDPVVQETADLTAWFQSWIDAGLKTSLGRDFIAESAGGFAYITCAYSVERHAQDGSFVVEHGKALQIFKRDESGT
ncbi:MAG: DUF4440 domain-containing protein [Pseudomonadota bacterium]